LPLGVKIELFPSNGIVYMRLLVISPSMTIQDDDSLNRYFNDLKRISLLSAEEERSLIFRVKKGEKEAFDRLITGNLRFVISVAKRYQNRGVSITDLINEGNIGLMKAAEKFDESHECKFISFAVWSIRQAIQLAIIEQSRVVHLPYSFNTIISKYRNGIARLEQTFNRNPSVEEVSEFIKENKEKVEIALSYATNAISFDKPIGIDDSSTLHDVIATKDQHIDQLILRNAQKFAVKSSLSILNGIERGILTMHFGLDKSMSLSLTEIARRLDLPVDRVRKLKDKALKKLKRSSYSPLLKSCLQ